MKGVSEMEKVKHSTVEEVEMQVLESMRGLCKALAGDDLRETFSWSRDLLMTMFSMAAYPSVWLKGRVNKAVDLLQQAADVTVCTIWHEQCAKFPVKFREHAESTQQRRVAFEALP